MVTSSLPFRLFVLASLLQIGAEAAYAAEVAAIVKPLLMPLLAWAWRASVPDAPTTGLVLTAIAAAWVGDVALMLAPANAADAAILGIPKHPLWFLVGVAAFAVTHLCFLRLYRDVERDVPTTLPWTWTLPPLLFGAGAAAIVLPAVLADPERAIAAVPVGAYAGLLMTMVIQALRRHGRVSPRSFALTAAGAGLFLFSDAMIGLSQLWLHGAMPQAGAIIMVTYLGAMGLIVSGLAERWRSRAA